MIDLIHARKLRSILLRAAASLDDSDALQAIEFYERWVPNHIYSDITQRIVYNNVLYRVKQPHTSQSDWSPDIATSLYEVVPEPGQGETISNPIPYNGNMKLENGKYYSQYGVTYICIRDTGIAVYSDLSALIEVYVRVAS